jgi:bifunctional UDP-N-acetylglucosamine pyrophosphorylase/glucosamine-1-phosphate N-acetyltransferase
LFLKFLCSYCFFFLIFDMNLHVCILAAGQSKRFKSGSSKLIHPLCGRPMIAYVAEAAAALKPRTLGVVVGHQKDQVISALSGNSFHVVEQTQRLGTGHAVSEFLKKYPDLNGNLLVINGDLPLVSAPLL